MPLKKDYNLRCLACIWYDTCRESFDGELPDFSSPAYIKELGCFHRA